MTITMRRMSAAMYREACEWFAEREIANNAIVENLTRIDSIEFQATKGDDFFSVELTLEDVKNGTLTSKLADFLQKHRLIVY